MHAAAPPLDRPPYLAFLGLAHAPFPTVPDPGHIFLPHRLDALITELLHATLARKGFMILTGEVGLGKTTISRRLLDLLDQHGIASSLVFNTFLQGAALLKAINRDFGAPHPEEEELVAQLEALNRFLIERDRAGSNSVIVIDDAQNLSDETLELVRLISNLETDRHKLVQILLVGQPELMERLETPGLRQLRSRIAIHAEVRPFDFEELRHYIQFKLAGAGHHGGIRIDDAAYRLIQERTEGNPRRINILMDRCLYGLFAYNLQELGRPLVEEVARELRMEGPPSSEPPPPPRPRRRPPLALSFLVTLLGGAAGIGGVLMGLSDHEPTVPMVQTVTPVAAVPAPATAPPAAAALKPAPAAPAGSAVARFLRFYGLEEYLPLLAQALREGRLAEAAGQIAEESGWHLVALPDPGYAGSRATLPRLTADGPRHLIFWRPRHWVEDLRPGRQDEAVFALQLALAELGYYPGPVDGAANPATGDALAAFQEAHGLPVSGLPDAASQYLLSLPPEPAP